MGNKRRNFNAIFKAKVALEALKEKETLSELSVRFGVHPQMISRWKQEFIEHSSEIFDKKVEKESEELDVKRMYAKIGQLELERDFLADACKRAGLPVKGGRL